MKTTETNKMAIMGHLLPKILIVAAIIIAAGVIWFANSRPPVGVEMADKPLSLVEPPATCGYCEDNLIGKTAEEIGQYTANLAEREMDARGPVNALVRSIVWNDAPGLGLGCLADTLSMEDPPMVLVILKGDLNPGAKVLGGNDVPADKRRMSTVIVVMDLWVGHWNTIRGDRSGEKSRNILDYVAGLKPLPDPQATCSPRVPKTLHYGDELLGIILPTIPPEATATVGPTVEPPLPVPTQEKR